MRRDAYRIGGRMFYLPVDIADQVTNLHLTDPAAALALADRHGRSIVPHGSSVSTSIHLLDGHKPMQTLTIDGKTLNVDDQTAAVIRSLQGQNAALSATLRDRAGDQVKDAGAAMVAALRAEDAATKDPKTPAGSAAERLRNAWKDSSDV